MEKKRDEGEYWIIVWYLKLEPFGVTLSVYMCKRAIVFFLAYIFLHQKLYIKS
jgi:hypothetical protein